MFDLFTLVSFGDYCSGGDMGKLLELKDLCCNVIVSMTADFGPRIDKDEAVLEYLNRIWNVIYEQNESVKNQPYIKLLTYLNYLAPPVEAASTSGTYNRLKIYMVAKHNVFVYDDSCAFKPIIEVPSPFYDWFGHCNRVTELFIPDGLETNLKSASVILSNCKYLQTLNFCKFLPSQIFSQIHADCFTSLKSIQIGWGAAENFSSKDFLKYFLGIDHESPSYKCFKESLVVCLYPTKDDCANLSKLPEDKFLIRLKELHEKHMKLDRNLKVLTRAAVVKFVNIEDIEIFSRNIEAAALVLGFVLLSKLTHILVSDYVELNYAFMLFYFLKSVLQFDIEEIKIKKIKISQDIDYWWESNRIFLTYFIKFREIEVYDSPNPRIDILRDIKDFSMFGPVTSLKVDMQYRNLFNSLLVFLQSSVLPNNLRELKLDSFEASSIDRLVQILQFFPELNTLYLKVQGRGIFGRIFSQISISSVKKLHLTAIHPLSSDEILAILKYFKEVKNVYINVATCTLVSGLAYRITLNLKSLELLCVHPFSCCDYCEKEMDNQNYDSRMQIFAWNILYQNKIKLVIDTENCAISLDKLDHMKLSGWVLDIYFEMPTN